MAFILGEMGAMKGFQDRSDVTRLNALVSVLTVASVWRMDNGGWGCQNHDDQPSSCCNTQRKDDDGAQQGDGCGGRGVLGFWMHLFLNFYWSIVLGFTSGSDGKESACNAADPGSIPGLGRSPGEQYGNPLQHFFLENSMDRGAWWATLHRVTKSWT